MTTEGREEPVALAASQSSALSTARDRTGTSAAGLVPASERDPLPNAVRCRCARAYPVATEDGGDVRCLKCGRHSSDRPSAT
jgi:hypothetical protein